jgi:methionyl-tRNA synthetase
LAKRVGVEADAQGLASALQLARDQFIQQFDDLAFSRALETVWTVIARVDKMISDAKPWELAKSVEQNETLNAVLYRAAESLRWIAVLLYPFLPETMRALWTQLGLTDDVEKFNPQQLTWGGLQAGTRIGEVAALFPRLDRNKVMAEIENENNAQQTRDATNVNAPSATSRATEADAVPGSPTNAETKPVPPQQGVTEADAVASAKTNEAEGVVQIIGIEDFVKVELRVAQILTAERVPKSDKLLRFTVDVGEAQPRQILAGIAEHYEPEILVGRKIVVVANLKPRKLRGFESQGMVLAASVGEEGKPILATFTEDVPNGAKLK